VAGPQGWRCARQPGRSPYNRNFAAKRSFSPMSVATHAPAAAPKEEYFKYTNLGPLLFSLVVAGVVSLLVCIIGAIVFGLKQFLFSWLLGFTFFFTMTAGALFWTFIHFAFDAEWSVVVRRILETMAGMFKYLWIFFLPIVFWAPRIYGWMTVPVGADPVLDSKRAMLTPSHWAFRTVIYFSFFFTASYLFKRWSTRQDQTGDPGYTTASRKLAFACAPTFALCLTFAAVDWLMSISYHWYSTMWGVYIFAGSAWSSMALLIIIVHLLQNAGYLKGIVGVEHYHIMGKLLLSFTVFWAYISFSQFFLIWYANIPEETEYFLTRNTESWNTLSIWLLVVCHFFVTFALLCPRVSKRNPKYLFLIACWVLCMHFCDMYILIMPFFKEKGFSPNILDIFAPLTIGAPLVCLFIQSLGRHSLYPVRDPRLPESLRLVN
jgi:hypothetical protein